MPVGGINDESLTFGVVALECARITQAQFLEAAAEVHARGGSIRQRLIETIKLDPDAVEEIDGVVRQKRSQESLKKSRETYKVATIRRSDAVEDSLKKAFGQARYDLQGELGRGGLGVVKRVFDINTQRSIAYKTLRIPGKKTDEIQIEELAADDIKRFREEALVCAQLEHPNIVPVYEIGEDPRGMPFYTMRCIAGKTLSIAIAEYHNQRMRVHLREAPPTHEELDALSLMRSRLYHTFADVCKAIAYAHSKGVIHRDIKSDNVMVGAYGETILLDWGIAKVKGVGDEVEDEVDYEAIREQISSMRNVSSFVTLDGAIMGTPSYMSPEQAAGRGSEIDEISDVYSLGAVLYEILVDAPPFASPDLYDTLAFVQTLPPIAPATHLAMLDAAACRGEHLESLFYTVADVPKNAPLKLDRTAIPHEIERIVLRALEKDRGKRFQSARALYDAVLNFLEGSAFRQQQRDLSNQALAEAEEIIGEYDALRESILSIEVEEAALRSRTKSFTPVEEKQELWNLEDKLRHANLEVRSLYNAAVAKLTAANGFSNTNRRARERTSAFFWEHLLAAEARNASDEAAFCEAQVRQYDDGQYTEGLKGDGTLTLHFNDPEADILCFRYFDNGRRSMPVALDLWERRDSCIPDINEDGTLGIGSELYVDFALIGKGALVRFPLEMGSYMILLRRAGVADVRLPVLIERSEQLSFEIDLPTRAAIAPSFEYIPSSRFVFGGDPQSNNVQRQVLDSDAFAIGRFPVTSEEYLHFLNEIEPEEAHARQPREGYSNNALWICADGTYNLAPSWHPRAPVVGVSWEDAKAYAAWLSAEHDRSYALPTEAQWEHAARGADGRFFPWGWGVDATFLNAAGARAEGPSLVPVDAYPTDESPFGVRGMGGNVRDWCQDTPGSRRKDMRIVRGGFWSNPAGYARAASRPALNQLDVSWEVGFRLVQLL